jgi:hypothetical protein
MQIFLYKPLNIQLTNGDSWTAELSTTLLTSEWSSDWGLAPEGLKTQEPSPMLTELLIELNKSIGMPTYNSTMMERQKTYQFSSQTWGGIKLS